MRLSEYCIVEVEKWLILVGKNVLNVHYSLFCKTLRPSQTIETK